MSRSRRKVSYSVRSLSDLNDGTFLGVKELFEFIFLGHQGVVLILQAGDDALHFARDGLAHLRYLFSQGDHLGMFVHKLLAQLGPLNLQIDIPRAQATDGGIIEEGRIFGTLRQISTRQEFPQLIELCTQGHPFTTLFQRRQI